MIYWYFDFTDIQDVLEIYGMYQRYIDEYFGKKYGRLKIDQNSWKYKKNLLKMQLKAMF